MPEPRRLGRVRLALLAILLAAPLAAQQGGVDEALAKGRTALARSDGVAAEIAFKQALSRGASRDAVAAGMGEALLDQGLLDKAREWLGPARFAGGDRLRGLRALAKLEIEQGNLPAAGKALDKALALAPRNAELWVDVAQLRYRGGEQLQAIDAIDRAIAADPGNLRAIDFRGLIVRDQFGPSEALQWFERGLKLAPNNGILLADYAATLGELGKARQMLAVTRKMLELGVETDRAFFLQGVLAARAGDLSLARAMLNRLGGRLGQTAGGLLLDAVLDLQDGNGNLAAEKLSRIAEEQPQNEEVQLLLARALMASGQQAELIKRFAAAAQRPEASVYLLTLMGRAHEDLGQREVAAPYIDRAAAVRKGGLDLVFDSPVPTQASDADRIAGQVRQAFRSGNFAAAAPLAEQLRQRRVGLGAASVLLGDVRFAQGRYGEAVSAYGEAARVRFDDQLLAKLVLSGTRSGKGLPAATMLGGYLQARPQSRVAARIAADYAASVGDWQRATALLTHLRRTGGQRDARLLTDLAFAQLRSGDAAAAEETAKAAFALQRSSPVAAQAWALALQARKRDLPLARALANRS